MRREGRSWTHDLGLRRDVNSWSTYKLEPWIRRWPQEKEKEKGLGCWWYPTWVKKEPSGDRGTMGR